MRAMPATGLGATTWIAAAALAAACTTPQPLRPDAGAIDAPVGIDAPSDAGARDDAPGLDASAGDAPAADAPPPASDGGPDGGPDAPREMRDAGGDAPLDAPASLPDVPGSMCAMLYGSQPGFVLCSETPTECQFLVTAFTAGGDCREVCQSATGWDCASVFRTSGTSCLHAGSQACGSPATPAICRCIF